MLSSTGLVTDGSGSDSEGDAYLAMAAHRESAMGVATGGRALYGGRATCLGRIRMFCMFAMGWIVNCCTALRQALGTVCGCGQIVRINGTRFRLVRLLGEGAYAQVHEVIDPRGRHMALKRLVIQEPDQRTLAMNEIRTHQRLGNACAYIMPLLDHEVVLTAAGREEGLLVMPLFASSLHDLLARRMATGRLLSEREALRRIAEVCVATERMHALDPPLSHRDIKPANIMLTEDGEAVLADFGSAAPGVVRVTSRFHALNVQEEAAQFCSMPYRAPELFDVGSTAVITPKTDVWSIGCTLYAMMYGYSPFECEFVGGKAHVVETSHLRVLADVRFPRVGNRASDGFMNIIRWLLTRDADERPTVTQVLDRLRDEFGVNMAGRPSHAQRAVDTALAAAGVGADTGARGGSVEGSSERRLSGAGSGAMHSAAGHVAVEMGGHDA